VCAGAGEIEEGKNITEIMIDDVGFAEGQFHHGTCMGHSRQNTQDEGDQH
jgi:hypothetical protein